MAQTYLKNNGLRYISVIVTALIMAVFLQSNVKSFRERNMDWKPMPRNISIGNNKVTGNEPSFKSESRLHSLCESFDTDSRSYMTSTNYSRLNTIKFDNFGNIIVAIKTNDMTAKPKTSGGDVIVIWANETNGKGLVSGQVVDHRNGSYTGILKVFWTGMTKVSAKLASSIENTCLRMKAINKYGNAVFAMQKPWGIRGLFRTNLIKVITACGANPKIVGFRDLCNFTSLNGGMSWYCGKPKNQKIQCSDIYSFGTGAIDNRMVSRNEKIIYHGHGIFTEFISLEIQLNEQTQPRNSIPCSQRSRLLSWTELEPTGFWLHGKWKFINCYSNIQQTVAAYTQCLKNKNLIIIGDSTLRQYAEYFAENVLRVNLKGLPRPKRIYHPNEVFSKFGINLMYIKHEMPFHNPDFPVKGILSVPQILHTIAERDFEDNSLILVINYNSHFSAYPATFFRERIRHLVVALESFLQKKPRAKVLIKGPHLCIDDTRWFDSRISLLYKDIMKEEFARLMNNVIYLDTWSITVAHNSELLHPTGDAFVSQINQLMSYIC